MDFNNEKEEDEVEQLSIEDIKKMVDSKRTKKYSKEDRLENLELNHTVSLQERITEIVTELKTRILV